MIGKLSEKDTERSMGKSSRLRQSMPVGKACPQSKALAKAQASVLYNRG